MLGSSLLSGGVSKMILWCPEGAIYHPMHKLCISSQYALGPFSPEMKRSCENVRGIQSYQCSEHNWDIFFAGIIRGPGACPPGTSQNQELNACTDSNFAYGPFTSSQVQQCKKLNWGFVCEVMRWPLAVLRGEQAPPAPVVNIPSGTSPWIPSAGLAGINGRLLAYYSNPDNYRNVHAQVMSWFGTTQNACVAFMSTALRNAGVNVPRVLNSKGYNISTWTAALSEYLESQLGWRRIQQLNELSPGDVVFTLDIDGSRGTPAHVFLFVEWADARSTWARVIDNQGFLHRRDLAKNNGGQFTPFQYALRSQP